MAAFRPDIQALRAVAVLLVLAFHVWPAHVRGGYIGVDVFFVISGYLITGHLWREVAATGRVDLPGFYARRARRLLPAASLTLLVVGLASYLWMPSWTWATTAADIAASTGYAENWIMVRRAVDYQAQGQTPSPLQHFWSLAVEEQFYFGWPLLVAGVAWLWGRRRDGGGGCGGGGGTEHRPIKDEAGASFATLPTALQQLTSPPSPALPVLGPGATAPGWAPPRRAYYALPMAALCLASFVSALVYARANPQAGYFTTHTRLYELGMGGLLAVVAGVQTSTPGSVLGGSTRAQSWVRTLAAVAGLAAIGASATLFTAGTHFPGTAALAPTLGACALLWAGEQQDGGDSDTRAHALVAPMSHPWLQYVGDVSYSLYLAHWPVVVIYPFATGRAVEGVLADGVLVCVISLTLAHACKWSWEDRFRSSGGGGRGGGCGSEPLVTAKQQLAGGATTTAGVELVASAPGTQGLAAAPTGSSNNSSGHAGPGSGSGVPIGFLSPRRRRLSAGAGALVMTLLMVTATLSASFALHRAAPAVAHEGGNVASPGKAQDDMAQAPATPLNVTGGNPAAAASGPLPPPSPPRLPPSPECKDFFGPTATRPYPGADAALHRCTTVNSLSVKELLTLANTRLDHGRVHDKFYPNADIQWQQWMGKSAPVKPPPSRLHHVVMMGDSHGLRWGPAMDLVGRRLGLNVTNLSKSGCSPGIGLESLDNPGPDAKPKNDCEEWNIATIKNVVRMQPDAVIMVVFRKRLDLKFRYPGIQKMIAAALTLAAQKLVSANIPVLYIKSTPVMRTRTMDCLAQEIKRVPAGSDLSSCSVPREEGVSDGIMEVAARMYPMMRRMTFDDIFCPDDMCPPAIGNVVVYADGHHMTKSFSLSLAIALRQKLLEKAPHLGSKRKY